MHLTDDKIYNCEWMGKNEKHALRHHSLSIGIVDFRLNLHELGGFS